MKKCKATIEFADDYGDNETTFRCALEQKHKGNHAYYSYTPYRRMYHIEWSDERGFPEKLRDAWTRFLNWKWNVIHRNW